MSLPRNSNLPIIEVVAGGDVEKEAYTGDGDHVNSDFLNGLGKEEAITKHDPMAGRKRNRNEKSDVPPT